MVTNSIKKHATKIAENNNQDEYMVIRLEHVKPAVNLVHIYGPIESRTIWIKFLRAGNRS